MELSHPFGCAQGRLLTGAQKAARRRKWGTEFCSVPEGVVEFFVFQRVENPGSLRVRRVHGRG